MTFTPMTHVHVSPTTRAPVTRQASPNRENDTGPSDAASLAQNREGRSPTPAPLWYHHRTLPAACR